MLNGMRTFERVMVLNCLPRRWVALLPSILGMEEDPFALLKHTLRRRRKTHQKFGCAGLQSAVECTCVVFFYSEL